MTKESEYTTSERYKTKKNDGKNKRKKQKQKFEERTNKKKTNCKSTKNQNEWTLQNDGTKITIKICKQ